MDSHTFHPLTLDPRSAGQVTRYHSWPRIKDQSVGEHSWQVIRLLIAIWPDTPRHVIVYAMFHDTGERVTGDVPYPVKAERPAVKEAFDAMEQVTLEKMSDWGVTPFANFSMDTVERVIFKLVEFIEMSEWAMDEVALGNKNARLIMVRCLEQANKILATGLIPTEIHDRAKHYLARRRSHEEDYRS